MHKEILLMPVNTLFSGDSYKLVVTVHTILRSKNIKKIKKQNMICISFGVMDDFVYK